MSPAGQEVVADRLRRLREYVADLEPYRATTWETFERDKVLRRFVERTVHLACECCLDIGSHVISAEGFREPDGNRDIFAVLGAEGVLDPELAEKMKGMASFRNVVVHEYTRVDPKVVFGVLVRHVDDFVAFARTIVAWLGTPRSVAADET